MVGRGSNRGGTGVEIAGLFGRVLLVAGMCEVDGGGRVTSQEIKIIAQSNHPINSLLFTPETITFVPSYTRVVK